MSEIQSYILTYKNFRMEMLSDNKDICNEILEFFEDHLAENPELISIKVNPIQVLNTSTKAAQERHAPSISPERCLQYVEALPRLRILNLSQLMDVWKCDEKRAKRIRYWCKWHNLLFAHTTPDCRYVGDAREPQAALRPFQGSAPGSAPPPETK
jgi:hypothetical protein